MGLWKQIIGEEYKIPKDFGPKDGKSRIKSWLDPAGYHLRSMYNHVIDRLPSPAAYTKPLMNNLRSMRGKPKSKKIKGQDREFILGEPKTPLQAIEKKIFDKFRADYEKNDIKVKDKPIDTSQSGHTHIGKEPTFTSDLETEVDRIAQWQAKRAQIGSPQPDSSPVTKHQSEATNRPTNEQSMGGSRGKYHGLYERLRQRYLPQSRAENIWYRVAFGALVTALGVTATNVYYTQKINKITLPKTVAERVGQTPQAKVETPTSPQKYAITQTQPVPTPAPSIPAPQSQAATEALAPYKSPKTIEDKVARTYVSHTAQRGEVATKIILKYHFNGQTLRELVTNVAHSNELSPNQKLQEGYEVKIPISYRDGTTGLVTRYARNGETPTELSSRELNNRVNKYFAEPNNLNGGHVSGIKANKIFADKEYIVTFDDEGEVEPIDRKPVQKSQGPITSRYEQAPQKIEPKKAEKTAMGQLENKITNVATVPNSLRLHNGLRLPDDPVLRRYTLELADYYHSIRA